MKRFHELTQREHESAVIQFLGMAAQCESPTVAEGAQAIAAAHLAQAIAIGDRETVRHD